MINSALDYQKFYNKDKDESMIFILSYTRGNWIKIKQMCKYNDMNMNIQA